MERWNVLTAELTPTQSHPVQRRHHHDTQNRPGGRRDEPRRWRTAGPGRISRRDLTGNGSRAACRRRRWPSRVRAAERKQVRQRIAADALAVVDTDVREIVG